MLMTERSFGTETISINCATGVGEGPPLVLLHGFMHRWQALLPIVPSLSARWRVFAPDMRGHGRSGRAPDGVYRRFDLVADVVALIEGVVGRPAVLFSHSAGAFAAVEVAACFPHLSRAVVVGDMSLDLAYLERLAGTPEPIAYHRAMRDLAGLATVEIVGRLATMSPDLDPAIRTAIAESLRHLDPRMVDCHAEGRLGDLLGNLNGDELLRQITSPVLLIQADPQRGAVMPNSYVAHVLELLRDGHHARLDGVGHNLGLDTGEVGPLLRALTPFLDSLMPTPSEHS